MEDRIGRITRRGDFPAMVVSQIEDAETGVATANLCVFSDHGCSVEHNVPMEELAFYGDKKVVKKDKETETGKTDPDPAKDPAKEPAKDEVKG